MIQRYVYGSMIETDTIPVKPEAGKEPLPGFTVDEKEHSFTYLLGKEDRIYGLGAGDKQAGLDLPELGQ